MTRRSSPLLRVAPPTLEPDPVLLHQLVELSASSSSSARTRRYSAVRALAGAATVAVIGATTWVAGAASEPTGLGAGPGQAPTTETVEVPTPVDDVQAAPADVASSAPGSPWSPGLPGTESPENGAAPTQQHDHKASRHSSAGTPADDRPGNGWGRQRAPGQVKKDANVPGPRHGNGHKSSGQGGSKRHQAGNGHHKGVSDTSAHRASHDSGGGKVIRHGNGHGKGHRNGHGKGHRNGHGKGHGIGHSKHSRGRGRH